MGISGLLNLLKSIQREIHIRDWAAQIQSEFATSSSGPVSVKVAVDAYCWLHRGAFGCAWDIALKKPTKSYVNFCMRRVNMLREHNISPILVFDGGYLPMKHKTEVERRKVRETHRAKGMEYLKQGEGPKAYECFQKSLDITPEIALELIKALKEEGVDYIVAPYEADAQLAYLERNGFVHAVITEDSDLLVFGCRRVIYKLDEAGYGTLIESSDFSQIPEFRGWTHKKFRQMCILSGCDYLSSPPGFGIKSALKNLQIKSIDNLFSQWSWGDAGKAPKLVEGYKDMFKRAELAFEHQLVYDPREKKLVPLNPYPDDFVASNEDVDFLGPFLPDGVAHGIAIADLNPITKIPFKGVKLDSLSYLSEEALYFVMNEICNFNERTASKENHALPPLPSPVQTPEAKKVYLTPKRPSEASNPNVTPLKSSASQNLVMGSSTIKSVTKVLNTTPTAQVRRSPIQPVRQTNKISEYFQSMSSDSNKKPSQSVPKAKPTTASTTVYVNSIQGLRRKYVPVLRASDSAIDLLRNYKCDGGSKAVSNEKSKSPAVETKGEEEIDDGSEIIDDCPDAIVGLRRRTFSVSSIESEGSQVLAVDLTEEADVAVNLANKRETEFYLTEERVTESDVREEREVKINTQQLDFSAVVDEYSWKEQLLSNPVSNTTIPNYKYSVGFSTSSIFARLNSPKSTPMKANPLLVSKSKPAPRLNLGLTRSVSSSSTGNQSSIKSFLTAEGSRGKGPSGLMRSTSLGTRSVSSMRVPFSQVENNERDMSKSITELKRKYEFSEDDEIRPTKEKTIKLL